MWFNSGVFVLTRTRGSLLKELENTFRHHLVCLVLDFNVEIIPELKRPPKGKYSSLWGLTGGWLAADGSLADCPQGSQELKPHAQGKAIVNYSGPNTQHPELQLETLT